MDLCVYCAHNSHFYLFINDLCDKTFRPFLHTNNANNNANNSNNGSSSVFTQLKIIKQKKGYVGECLALG